MPIRRLLMALLLAATSLKGAPITFVSTGRVTEVPAVLADTFSTSQIMSGLVTFESTLPDSNSTAGTGWYRGLTLLTVSVGGYTSVSGHTDHIFVRNDLCCALDDYWVQSLGMGGPSVSGLRPDLFDFILEDHSALVFNNDSLPLVPPPLAAFDLTKWGLRFTGATVAVVRGEMTSLTLVPEPTALLFLGSGLIGLSSRWKNLPTRGSVASSSSGPHGLSAAGIAAD
jgi:hypothetical protein